MACGAGCQREARKTSPSDALVAVSAQALESVAEHELALDRL